MTELRNQFKNQGLSVQSTENGIAIVDAKTKSVTLLKDENGKPFKTLRDDDSLKWITALANLSRAANEAGDHDLAKVYLSTGQRMFNAKSSGGIEPPNRPPLTNFDKGQPSKPAASTPSPLGGTSGSHAEPADAGFRSSQSQAIRAEIRDKQEIMGRQGVSQETKDRLSMEIAFLQQQLNPTLPFSMR